MGDEENRTMHIAMFPWLAFGHMIPYLNFAKQIAQKGHKISFISTPRNIDRLPKLAPELASSISFVKISLPKVDQLPEDVEATVDIRCGDQMDLLKIAYDGLEAGVTGFLENSAPDWVIYDLAHWLPAIAARLGISRAAFSVASPWLHATMWPCGSVDHTSIEDFMAVPKWVDFETTVSFRRFEAKWMLNSRFNEGCGITDFHRFRKVFLESEIFLLRHCYELEHQWINVLKKIAEIPVVPVGLLVPPDELENSNDNDNNNDDNAWLLIKEWLDGQDKGSVVYVGFGSEANLSQDQVTELALGLALSGVAFFWVLRGENSTQTFTLPCEFEMKIKGRGMVWKHWAPQMSILRHNSIGGFLTHCGYSSVLETLKFGHPLIGLPIFVDQGLIARFVVEKGFGCEIPRNDEDGSYTKESVANSIRLVMVGNEGKAFREKAKELSDGLFGDTMLQEKYTSNVVKLLQNHRSGARQIRQ